MAAEAQKTPFDREKGKLLALAGLAAVLTVTIYFTYFKGSPDPGPPKAQADKDPRLKANSELAAGGAQQPGTPAGAGADASEITLPARPLDFTPITSLTIVDTSKRNVFDFY